MLRVNLHLCWLVELTLASHASQAQRRVDLRHRGGGKIWL